jgi:predicted transcriptional regulator
MRQENVHYFTEKEEEFIDLLTEIGVRKNMAVVLVFLINVPEATSREIERGTDLRQPEVSVAIKYLKGQGWMKSKEIPSERKGRPNRKYSLGLPVKEIMAELETAKKNEIKNRLARIGKIRDYIS